MSELFVSAPTLLTAIIAGYLLGALPLADQISRRHAVDIFTAGTGLAGASNVRRTVGGLPALVVLLGDVGKGALAVIVAERLGVEGPWLLLPVSAAVAGHWKSVFSRLRGGDSLAVLGGATIALFPVFGMISVVVAMVVALGGQRMPYSSLFSIVLGYAILVSLSVASNENTVLAVGVGGVSGLVLAHAILGHCRRRSVDSWEEIEDAEASAEQSGVQ